MAPSLTSDTLGPADKDAAIPRLLARVDELAARLEKLEAEKFALRAGNAALVAENALLLARVAELETRLGLPPKTPDNSSTPPSQGRKASDGAASKPKGKPHAGANRPLHPNPTARRDMMAAACQHCGADVSGVPQIVCEAYEAIEIPEIKPDITRVTLSGGTCPCCAKRFKAAPPQGLKRARKLHPENWGLSIH